ncbi:MAG TPA: hypothetical protein ENF20_06945 [Candidatus Marinimicrobia bacterium]|nr:hypothetical protein [Candidatus Neomarinimicrobiota bacterium]
MRRRIILILLFLSITSISFAHSGRLDSNGGHRVNKKWVYEGKYLAIVNGVRTAREGKVAFFPGGYHHHVHPNYVPHVKNGIFLPVDNDGINATRTDNVHHSLENVIVSKESDIYHNPWSGYVRNMRDENVIIFTDYKEAEENGYKASSYFRKYDPGITKLSIMERRNLRRIKFNAKEDNQ